jgi:hypothetical protein
VPDDAIPSAKHHYRWTELLQVSSPDGQHLAWIFGRLFDVCLMFGMSSRH